MKGVYGKVSCRNENGQKPCMILVACNLQTLKFSEVHSSRNNNDSSFNHSSNSSVASDIVDSIDLANELPVTVNNAKVILVAPPMQESEIIGKWFAGIYAIGKKVLLYVGQATKGLCLTVTANQHILN